MAKRKEVDLHEVERLAGLGFTNEKLSLCLGMSEATLYRRQRESTVLTEAIKKGKAAALAAAAKVVFEKATMDRDLAAIILFEKTRAGHSDKISQDVTQRTYIIDLSDAGDT
ncbi:MAG: hypothetical protein NVSMB42_04670 [Herpetosiphon sp.]